MAYQLTQDCIDMDVEMSASAHSVLVVLCRHANDAGECFPATALIAKKAHLNPRTVMQAVKELEQGAWISSTQAPGKRRRFLIDVAKIQSFVPSEGNSAPAESYTTEESYTPAENCTTVKRCRPPLQEVTGDPCKKVQGTTAGNCTRIEHIKEQEENKEEVRATQIFSAEKIARPEPDLCEEINAKLRDAVNRDPDDFDPTDATPEELDIFDTEPLPASGTKAATCPVTEIVALYNQKLGPYLRTVRKMTPARAQAVRARWRDVAEIVESQDRATVMEGMSDYFDKIARSNFLMGRVPGKAWRADFDFIFSQRGFTRIFEDKYANG